MNISPFSPLIPVEVWGKRAREDDAEEPSAKRAKLNIGGTLHTVHQLTSRKQLSLQEQFDLPSLMYEIAANVDNLTTSEKKGVEKDLSIIQSQLLGEGDEKRTLVQEIDLFLIALNPEIKSARDEYASEEPDAKRAPPETLEISEIESFHEREKRSFLKIMVDVPESQRADVSAQVALLIEGVSFDKRLEVLRTVIAIPQGQRVDLLAVTTSLIHGSDRHASIIREEIIKIILNQKAEMLIQTVPLFQGIEDDLDRIEFMKIVTTIPSDRRKDIEQAAPWLQGITKNSDRVRLFTAFTAIPPAERRDVAEAAHVLLEFTQVHERDALLDAVVNTPQELRRDITQTVSLFLGFVDIWRMLKFLGSLITIPQRYRTDMLIQTASWIENLTRDAQRNTLLLALSTYTIQDRRGDLVQAAPLFQGLGRCNDILALVDAVMTIPPDQRADVIVQVIPLVHEDSHVNERILFLEGVANQNAYLITLDRKELEADPKKVLHILTAQFSGSTRKEIRVQFMHEEGIDAGGLGRQFISELFDGIKNKMKFKECENGLYRPELMRGKNGKFEPLSEEDRTTLHELGCLMMFCLNSTGNYPIGLLFDRAVFVALLKFLANNVTDLEKLNFEKLFSIYEAMNYTEDDTRMIARMKECLQPLNNATKEDVLKNAYAAVEGDNGIERLGIDYDVGAIRQYYPEIQAVLKRQITEEMILPQLLPLVEISNGMRSAPFQESVRWVMDRKWAVTSPEEFANMLQGTVTKEMILGRLKFSNLISAEKRGWIKNWIERADNKKRMQFLFAMTGSRSLGTQNLTFAKSNETVNFHACSNKVDIPIDAIASEEMLASILDATLDGKEFSIG